MDKKIKFETVRPLIDEAFSKNEKFGFYPNGISMKPFIKGGQSYVEIEKYTGGAKKYDIVFYIRPDGKYVLHRIVKIYPESFGICGDNGWWIEKVGEEDIFAKVCRVDGKKRMGSMFYLKTLWLRRFLIHVKKYINKHAGGKK